MAATGRGDLAKEMIAALLIPPSEFEKPARVSSRDRQETPRCFENQHPNQGTAASCAHTKTDYADELIRRQAAEITELRSELMKCCQAYDQDSADWKKKLAWLEDKHEADVKLLEKHLARAADEFEEKLSYQDSETSTLREKLQHAQMLLDTQVTHLQEQLSSVRQDGDNSRRQLEAQLREKSHVVDDQTQQIARLKTYICQAEEAHKPVLACRMEMEATENKLKISQAENHQLSSTLELVDVRCKALQEILSIQDKELGQARLSGTGRSKQATSLIVSWREKVFSLLVQQKSAEINHKREKSHLHKKVRDLEDEQSTSQAHLQVLQHSLTDRLAQLQIEVNNREKLQEMFDQTQQAAICLDGQSKLDQEVMRSLSECVYRTKAQTDDLMAVLEGKAGLLKTFAQRVSFASGRMAIIQTHLIRKSALCLGMSRDAAPALSNPPADQDVAEPGNGERDKCVYHELEKVTQERDSLAAQVRSDMDKWSDILAGSRSEYTAEISELTKKVEILEYQLRHKSQACAQLTDEIQVLRTDLKEKESEMSQLQTELAKHQRGVDSVLTDQRLKYEARSGEDLADLERKLNTCKRKHVKTVVSLRQMEQAHQRRLQQAHDLLTSTQDHLTRQVQQLEARLRSVERERNLMMATLRQEGLLDQLRADRGRFIQFVDEDNPTNSPHISQLNSETVDERRCHATEQVPGDSPQEGSSAQTLAVGSTSHQESVHFVLEDLKSLTAAVLDDDDDDDDGGGGGVDDICRTQQNSAGDTSSS